MSSTTQAFFRPDKLNNAQTVLYEIDMLRFTREYLSSAGTSRNPQDEWVYLESFLLHYRNLIEFFGKPVGDEDDLSIYRPEAIWGKKPPAEADLDFMKRPELREKYDTRDNLGAISKYLHHCTTQRTVARNWPVLEMFEELRPTLEKFESLLPQFRPATGYIITRGKGLAGEANSTTSTRILDSAFPFFINNK
jgi:hypothetical protein